MSELFVFIGHVGGNFLEVGVRQETFILGSDVELLAAALARAPPGDRLRRCNDLPIKRGVELTIGRFDGRRGLLGYRPVNFSFFHVTIKQSS